MTLMICRVATLVIVISAPLMTAPVGSLTVPTMMPVPTVWDHIGLVIRSITGNSQINNPSFLALVLISTPLMAVGPYRVRGSLIAGRSGKDEGWDRTLFSLTAPPGWSSPEAPYPGLAK